MKQTFLLLLFTIFTNINFIFAQKEEDKKQDEVETESDLPEQSGKITKYFDDGKKTMASKAIKLNITNLIVSNVSFSYEHKINNTWSLEATLGVTLVDIVNVNNSTYKKAYPLESPIIGVGAKYYFDQRGIDYGTYIAAGLIHKSYSFNTKEIYFNLVQDELKVSMNGFRLIKGRQLLIGKSIAIDLGSYFGIASLKLKEGKMPEGWDEIGWEYGAYLKVGLFIL